jgi:leucyl-tRNA synthetase
MIQTDASDEAVVTAACANEKILRLMDGMQLVRTIVVKNKLVNLILKPRS